MAFVITDSCVSCGTCAANCPAEAIDMGDDKYIIDQDKCIFASGEMRRTGGDSPHAAKANAPAPKPETIPQGRDDRQPHGVAAAP